LTILDVDGNAITPGANDNIRVAIGRDSEIAFSGDTVSGAEFVVVSGTPTANGSTLTKGAVNRLRLDDADLDFSPGTYRFYFDYYDNADGQEWKNIDREVFVLIGD
jgi:hypothetical protein